MKTYQQALDEFYNLLNDDPDFKNQWTDSPNDFLEWCSLYDDLEHIKNITWVDPTTWHCQSCNTYIDEEKQEMEMHECKSMEVA